MTVFAGTLAAALFFFAAAFASTINWRRVYRWYAVHWQQLPEDDRAVMRWMGRTAWVMVLLGTAML